MSACPADPDGLHHSGCGCDGVDPINPNPKDSPAMSVRYEWFDADFTGIAVETPGAQIGDDTLTDHALIFEDQSVAVITGTPVRLRAFL